MLAILLVLRSVLLSLCVYLLAGAKGFIRGVPAGAAFPSRFPSPDASVPLGCRGPGVERALDRPRYHAA